MSDRRLYNFKEVSTKQKRLLAFLYKEHVLGEYLKETLLYVRVLPCLTKDFDNISAEEFMDSPSLSFPWHLSAKGSTYWNNVFKNLMRYGQHGEI